MIHNSILKKQRIIVVVLMLLIIFTLLISLGLGYSSLSFNRILPTLFGLGDFKEEFVLFSIRIPRMIITLLAGMALAMSGAILQAVTKNDLADPGIIGINAGAGVAIAIFYLFFPIDTGVFIYVLPAVAFVGAFITACLIYLFSYEKGKGIHQTKLILIGVGFSMALSGIMVVLISAAEREKVDFIARWISGNIWGTDWPFIWAILPWLLLFIPIIFIKANQLNVLRLNDFVTIGLGVSLQKERIVLLTIAVALAALAVSVTGGIAFIGLMAPHIAKALIGPRSQLYIPIALLGGGWLLVVADTIGRNIFEPEGIPAGIMVALIGAPYFLYLLLKK
ncbi:iron-siderophore ABC transporter permease protein [Bacillus sp. TS-2]|nr:iron-siderophore ABC transporter permease protein [Bacillus sp. TS-2]